MVSRAVLLRLADSPKVENFIKRNGFSAGFARRFIAGERMEDVVEPVRALNALGITASLDYLGENVHKAEQAEEFVQYYLRLFDFIDARKLDSNVSLKLTQLGLDISQDLAYDNMQRILDHAARYEQFVRIDMEGSDYTGSTLSIFYRLWADRKNVGAVIQSYLFRSEVDTEKLIEAGARVRLVKGAYNEPASVAFQRKSEVDENFVKLMMPLLERGNYPAIATHDERIIMATIGHATNKQISPDRFEFQMLFGIRRERQLSLKKEGYNLRVYVPFGTHWYPYMMRRMAERPANLWFVLKNLLRR